MLEGHRWKYSSYISMHYPDMLYFDAVIQTLESLGAFMLKIHTLDVESFYTSVPIKCHMGLELFIYDEQVNSL